MKVSFERMINMSFLKNPLHILLWTVRRGEHDVVGLYNYLSGLMRIATKDYLLNFGYWDEGINSPREAQLRLCSVIADISNLYSARIVADIGSGFSVPAIYWKSLFNSLNIVCVDVNFRQLRFGVSLRDDFEQHNVAFPLSTDNDTIKEMRSSLDLQLPHLKDLKELSFVNSTSTALPFANNSIDRIIALESAQHFRPIGKFFIESNRVLEKNGILVTAIPVICNHGGLDRNSFLSEVKSSISLFLRLGILSFTWMSEHYSLDYVKLKIAEAGFESKEIRLIGSHVYEPLSKYYIQNREEIKSAILKEYPSHIEKILCKSILKMNKLSEDQVIDYAIIKAVKG